MPMSMIKLQDSGRQNQWAQYPRPVKTAPRKVTNAPK